MYFQILSWKLYVEHSEYQRVGSNWQQSIDNFLSYGDQLENKRMTIHQTFTVLNVSHLDESLAAAERCGIRSVRGSVRGAPEAECGADQSIPSQWPRSTRRPMNQRRSAVRCARGFRTLDCYYNRNAHSRPGPNMTRLLVSCDGSPPGVPFSGAISLSLALSLALFRRWLRSLLGAVNTFSSRCSRWYAASSVNRQRSSSRPCAARCAPFCSLAADLWSAAWERV